MQPTSGVSRPTTPPEDQPVVRPKVRASTAEVSSETETTTEETKRKKKKAKKKKAKPVPTPADVACALAPELGIETASYQKPRKVSTSTTTMLETLKTTGVVISMGKLMVGLQSLDLSQNMLAKQEAQTSSTPFITEAKKHFFASSDNELSKFMRLVLNLDNLQKANNSGQSETPQVKSLQEQVLRYFDTFELEKLISLLNDITSIPPQNITEHSLQEDLREILSVLDNYNRIKNIKYLVSSMTSSRKTANVIFSFLLCYGKLNITCDCIECYINIMTIENQVIKEEVQQAEQEIIMINEQLINIHRTMEENIGILTKGSAADLLKFDFLKKSALSEQHICDLNKICELLTLQSSTRILDKLKITPVVNAIINICEMSSERRYALSQIVTKGAVNDLITCQCTLIHQSTLIKILINHLTNILKK